MLTSHSASMELSKSCEWLCRLAQDGSSLLSRLLRLGLDSVSVAEVWEKITSLSSWSSHISSGHLSILNTIECARGLRRNKHCVTVVFDGLFNTQGKNMAESSKYHFYQSRSPLENLVINIPNHNPFHCCCPYKPLSPLPPHSS